MLFLYFLQITVSVMDYRLKPVRSFTRLPITVNSEANSSDILLRAITKLEAHDQKFLTNHPPPHTLLYPDGKVVNKLPENDSAFWLDKYKEQAGKDYSRITFYVASAALLS